MKKGATGLSGLSLLAIALVLLVSANINAQQRNRKRIHVKKEVVVKRNIEYRDIVVRKRHYYYREGYFYEKRPEGYVKIVAPIGASITVLPDGYKIIHVRKIRYYVFDGIYYRFYPKRKAYVVVKAPL